MSNTYFAGQKLRAVDMVPQKLWTVSSTTATSNIGTTETAVGTAPSSTYRAGRAYLISFRGIYRCNTAPANITPRIRDTNTSGTVRMTGITTNLVTNSLNYVTHWEHYVANTTASDITSRVLVLTLTSSSGVNTVLINAAAEFPWYINCMEIGDADDFPEAVAL